MGSRLQSQPEKFPRADALEATFGLPSLVQIVFQAAFLAALLQQVEGAGFELTDALAADSELATDLL